MIDAVHQGIKRAPSVAFKDAVKAIDKRVAEEAAALDLPLLTDLAEVRVAVEEVFKSGEVDFMASAEELREVCNIADEVLDHDILDALGDAVKDDDAPFLAFTLGDERVEVCVEVYRTDGPDALERALFAAKIELSSLDEFMLLQRVSDTESGDGILHAYRVPSDLFGPEDVAGVIRFGAPAGRYLLISQDDDATITSLEAALVGQPHEKFSVKNGVVMVAFTEAPGAPDGWAVGLIATDKRIVARFDNQDGRSEEVGWESLDSQSGRFAFYEFINNPMIWSHDLWRSVESRREAA